MDSFNPKNNYPYQDIQNKIKTTSKIYPKLYSSLNYQPSSPPQASPFFARASQQCEIDNLEQLLRTSIITASGLIWALAGFIPIAGDTIAAIGGVVNVLLPGIWSEDTNQQISTVAKLIDTKVDSYAIERADKELEGLKKVMEEYRDAVQIFQQNMKPRSVAAEGVRTQFRILHTAMQQAMPTFRIKNFEVQLLPTYAQVANSHLLILKEIINDGKKYEFDAATIESYYNDFERSIRQYTNHCVDTYKLGLDKKATEQANLSAICYPWTTNAYAQFVTYQGIEDLNIILAYKRMMTLLVLDYVALWPSYDPREYPNLNGVKTSLTREIYTNVRGALQIWVEYIPDFPYKDDHVFGIDQAWFIAQYIIRRPHLFQKLENIILEYNEKYTPAKYELLPGDIFPTLVSPEKREPWTLTGMNRFSLSAIPSQLFESFIGKKDKYTCQLIAPINTVKSWYSGLDGFGRIECLTKTMESIRDRKCGVKRDVNTDMEFIDEIPFEYTKGCPPHQLCWINAGASGSDAREKNRINYMGCTWMHPSVDSENTLSNRKITQIPAVMAQHLNANASVITGPGSTGGDLVKLQPNGSLTITFTIPKGLEVCSIRFRCVNTSKYDAVGLNLNMRINNVTVFDTGTLFFENDFYASDLPYQSFQLMNLGEVRLREHSATTQKCTLHLSTSEDSPDLLLDKIEFLPKFPAEPIDTTSSISSIARQYRLVKWEDGKHNYIKGAYFMVPDAVMDLEDMESLRYQLEIKSVQLKMILPARFVEHNKKEKTYNIYIDFTLFTKGEELPDSMRSFKIYAVDPMKDLVKATILDTTQ